MTEKKKQLTVSDSIKQDRKLKRIQEHSKITDKKYQHLLKQIDELEARLAFVEKLEESDNHIVIPSYESNGGGEATAFIVLSDWHIEEQVDPQSVNGLNEYNLFIAEERAKATFKNAARMLHVFQKDLKIKHVVLALLGDFFSGTIHDELSEENEVMPSDAALIAQTFLESGIRYLLRNSNTHFDVVCHSGNHGRMSKGYRYGNEAGHSLERYMYLNLAQRFNMFKRIKWTVPRGWHSYLDVYDMTVRFIHGHGVNYWGGVGGISIPLNKATQMWNQNKKADLTVLGHFHQFLDGGTWLVNGSLIGYNGYALAKKFAYEPPRQAFFIIDKKRGKTITSPIVPF